MKQLDRTPTEFTDMRRLPLEPQVHTEFEPARPALSTTHYLMVIYRHKWRILAFVATCMLLAYLVAARMTPIYQATATMDVDLRVPVGVVGQEAAQGPPPEDADTFLATQSELIQSDAVLRPVADKYHLLDQQLTKLPAEVAQRIAEAPVFLGNLKVNRPVNTYLLEIQYRSPDPKFAAEVANAIAKSYLEHTFEIRVQSSAALATFMEKQLDELRAKMERSDLALAKFERELNVINPEDKTNILSSRLLQLNTEFTAAQGDRVRKEAAFRSLQSGSVAAAEVSGQGDELSRLQDRVNQAKQQLATVASVYGPANKEYRKAANDLLEVQRQFEEMRRSVAQRVETDYKQALLREQMLGKAVNESKSEFDLLNARSFEYQQLKREAEANKTLYSDMERRIKEEAINSGFQNNSIRIADLARPPQEPVLPRKRLYVMLAFMGSLVLAISAAVLADVADNTIRDPEQAAHALDTSVLGTLPTVKEMRRLLNPGSHAADSVAQAQRLEESGGLARSAAPSKRTDLHRKHVLYPVSGRYEGITSYEEAVRTLRNAILLPDFDRNMRSLLVTSAMPAEGKSTCIIHLAIAHAEQGKRTLVIDADLRRPSVHKKLGIDGSIGLSNALLGEMEWKDAVYRTDDWPGLDVLPSGTASRRASDLIGSMMMDILDEAEAEYDLILVDAPPLLGFAETMQVATAVDGVVVMARAGQTSRRAVGSVLATLKRLRANVLGIVLNEVDKNSTHGYYYYHGDYRKYYSQTPEQAS